MALPQTTLSVPTLIAAVKVFVEDGKILQLDELQQRFMRKEVDKPQLKQALVHIAGRDALRQALMAALPNLHEIRGHGRSKKVTATTDALTLSQKKDLLLEHLRSCDNRNGCAICKKLQERLRGFRARRELVNGMRSLDRGCTICLTEQPTRLASLSGCSHCFCFACIYQWSARTNRCPICRTRFYRIVDTADTSCAVEVDDVDPDCESDGEDEEGQSDEESNESSDEDSEGEMESGIFFTDAAAEAAMRAAVEATLMAEPVEEIAARAREAYSALCSDCETTSEVDDEA